MKKQSVGRLPASIPRAIEARELREDPLGFLARARSRLGDVVVISDAGPIFSRAPDCVGAAAVFGPGYNRAVLGDIDGFGMPVSAAQSLSLPSRLVNLNFGLFSMRGEQHARHQRLLMRVLNPDSIEEQHPLLSAGLEAFAEGWQAGQQIALLGEMRRLALHVSSRLLFGGDAAQSCELGALIQAYFQLRREAASPLAAVAIPREELVVLGTALDSSLRAYIHQQRRQGGAGAGGIVANLAGLDLDTATPLSEDELVAHANVLFMSSSEPIAVALTWTFLILSQLPELRRALRRELDQMSPDGDVPHASRLAQLPLLDAVVSETLRLLPPNALMVRLTTRPARLHELQLPERCEVVVCPFLAHRDPERFARPDTFLPSRWSNTKPSAFEYFPFGAGGRYCMGRHLATCLIKTAAAFLLRRYDLVLSADQAIDWRVHVNLMPGDEPIMTVRTARASSSRKTGKLRGAVADLVRLEA